MATILIIFLKINRPNFSRLVRRRHTKFQIVMAAATSAIPLLASLVVSSLGAALHPLTNRTTGATSENDCRNTDTNGFTAGCYSNNARSNNNNNNCSREWKIKKKISRMT